MSFPINLFGLTTLEVLTVDQGRGDFWEGWSIDSFSGPTILLNVLRPRLAFEPRYLYPEHLRLLYSRFGDANPAGTEIGAGDQFFGKGLAHDLNSVREEEVAADSQSFVNLTFSDEDDGYPHLRRYLPEIFEDTEIDRMAGDPWLNVRLLGQALREGAVPKSDKCSPRWSTEWREYCKTRFLKG